ncbi:hypothetical protein [Aliiroseovarius subalbicans]|uniref:hypothetical protein n=1 Tax=Aliiroseovarius subalbicans TaxID=2925840 RepID=UPI001F56BB15|nr:hypothetical protein [Aliiroseovarius subalbicans]MCI2399130.1 hypothetical protein [Aliiroseovarius subalbicans]
MLRQRKSRCRRAAGDAVIRTGRSIEQMPKFHITVKVPLAATVPMPAFKAFDAQMEISPSFDPYKYTKRNRGCLRSDIP